MEIKITVKANIPDDVAPELVVDDIDDACQKTMEPGEYSVTLEKEEN